MSERRNGEPPVGKEFFPALSFLGGLYLVGHGLYELGASFLAPGQEEIRSTAVFKVVAGISVLVTSYREFRS